MVIKKTKTMYSVLFLYHKTFKLNSIIFLFRCFIRNINLLTSHV